MLRVTIQASTPARLDKICLQHMTIYKCVYAIVHFTQPMFQSRE